VLSRRRARLIPVFALLATVSACGGRAAISGDDQPGGGTVSSSSGTGGASGTLGTTNTGGSAHGGSGGQASTDWAACSAKDQCVLDAVGPCGPGWEPIALSQFIAINSVNVTAFELRRRPTTTPSAFSVSARRSTCGSPSSARAPAAAVAICALARPVVAAAVTL
jgi:hypothetical protein